MNFVLESLEREYTERRRRKSVERRSGAVLPKHQNGVVVDEVCFRGWPDESKTTISIDETDSRQKKITIEKYTFHRHQVIS